MGVISWHAYPRIGGISPHGVGIAVGYAIAGMLMVRHAARRDISSDHVWNMLMRAVFGVIVGARLFYVVGHPGEFFGAGRDPIDVLRIWQGGIVFYGGVFGGIAAAYPYMRRHGLSFKAVMDSAAPAFPLGLIFGRIGDIIVGDHLGGASTLPFAFRFYPYRVPADPSRYVAHGFGPTARESFHACFTTGCHQTALYDLVNVLVLLPVALWLARKRRPPGFLIAFTATWYGGARLLTDVARDAKYYLGLHGTQWASILLIVVGTWYMVRLSRRTEVSAPAGRAHVLPAGTEAWEPPAADEAIEPPAEASGPAADEQDPLPEPDGPP
jgi:phosphatidylglycerol:prolipoprotein diacylglycerol transferase